MIIGKTWEIDINEHCNPQVIFEIRDGPRSITGQSVIDLDSGRKAQVQLLINIE